MWGKMNTLPEKNIPESLWASWKPISQAGSSTLVSTWKPTSRVMDRERSDPGTSGLRVVGGSPLPRQGSLLT